MKKDLIDTIMEKEFHALSQVEREEMASYCANEEEYNQMKEVFLGMEQMTWDYPKPKAETKQRLDDLFDSTYPKAAPVWYNSVLVVMVPKDKPVHRQPLVQIAAVALLALLLVPFWKTNSEIVDSQEAAPQVAQVEKPEKPADLEAIPDVKPEVVNDSDNDVPVPDFDEITEATTNETPVLVAAAEPIVAAPSSAGASASVPAPGSTHPDGVFIAVSQPASESPEMFDLLTATF